MNRFIVLSISLLWAFSTFANQKVETFNTKHQPEFVPNQGQIADQNGNLRKDVKFVYAAPGFKVIFKENSWSYEVVQNEYFKPKKKSYLSEVSKDKKAIPSKFAEPDSLVQHIQRIDVLLRNANPNPKIITEEKSSFYTNYYLAHTPEEGVTNIYGYSKITYKDIYPNIDFVFYAQRENRGQLKYDIVVRAGGNINDIKFDYKGLSLKLINQQLNFEVNLNNTPVDFTENIPLSYDLLTHQPIKINYLRNIGGDISFKISDGGKNNNGIVIDPSLVWGTYFGGSNDDESRSVAVDASGNVFITGYTGSTSGIATSGAYQTILNYYIDAFLTKFSSLGNRIWSTYYGGDSVDICYGVNADCKSNVFITGYTYSTSGIATTGANQTRIGGGYDAFIAKFSQLGLRLWSTYFGGSNYDYCTSISTDESSNVFITGTTQSTMGIATSGGYDTSYNGGYTDVFLAKFSQLGHILWSTYFGGSNYDYGQGVTIDKIGNAIITGWTYSNSGISTLGAYQTNFRGNGDAFLTKFSNSGNRIWSTYFGADSNDCGYAVSNDTMGNIFITGYTNSTIGLATANGYQTIFSGGNRDGFLAKFTISGGLLWSTYFGGGESDIAYGVTTDRTGNSFITGYTESTSGIATIDGFQITKRGSSDAFLAKFSKSGRRLWSTYFGGNSYEQGSGVSTDSIGQIFITGCTSSSSGISTSGAFKTSRNDSGFTWDAFLVKFGDSLSDSLINTEIPNLSQKRISIVIYPNPTHDLITLELNNYSGNSANIQLMDIFGRMIYSKNKISSKEIINLEELNIPSGNYLLKVNIEGQEKVLKVSRW